MARKKRTSPFEDLVDVVSLLPWWACLGLALVSYFVLHALAKPVTAADFLPGQLSQAVTRGMFAGLAFAGQFIVPAICLFATVISAVAQRRRNGLVVNVAQSRAPDALHEMSWGEFEMLVGQAFKLQGFAVTETGRAGADGGVDLVLARGSEKFLVQCKQWKAFKVGVKVVRELYGVMAARGAAGGFVVTAGSFTPDAVAFAKGRNVTLIDGTELFRMIQMGRASAARKEFSASTSQEPFSNRAPPQTSEAQTCPACSRSMVLKLAKRGPNAGSRFWSCSGYPTCNGTRPVFEDR